MNQQIRFEKKPKKAVEIGTAQVLVGDEVEVESATTEM